MYVYNKHPSFNSDGGWSKSYRLPDNMKPGDISAPGTMHPMTLEIDATYICSTCMFRIRDTGVVLLDHILLDSSDGTYRSRVICIRPDGFILTGGGGTDIILVWPQEYSEEMKLVVASQGLPTVINTGIKSGEVMRERDWFTVEPLSEKQNLADQALRLDSLIAFHKI